MVAAVISDDEGRVLACRRAPHKSLAGLWEFPGGKVEPSETDQQALTREIHEELGVEIEVGDYLATSVNKAGDLDIELLAFRASLVGGDVVKSSDHDKFLWLKGENLEHLEWAPADVAFVPLIWAVE